MRHAYTMHSCSVVHLCVNNLCEQMYSEYDPSFWHMSHQAHQKAAEQRSSQKKISSRSTEESSAEPSGGIVLPICPPPPQAHDMFVPLRQNLLRDEALLAVLAAVLKACVQRSSSSSSGSGSGSAAVAVSETQLERAVLLLTLSVHVYTSIKASASGTASSESSSAQDKLRAYAANMRKHSIVQLLNTVKNSDWLSEDTARRGNITWVINGLEALTGQGTLYMLYYYHRHHYLIYYDNSANFK
jgi:murein L,D-transpeptidase YcbB/YkuD